MVNRGWVQSIQNADHLCTKTEGGLKEAKTFLQKKVLLPFWGILWYTAKNLRHSKIQKRAMALLDQTEV